MFHQLHYSALAHGARPNLLIHDLILSCSNFVEINLFECSFELQVNFFKGFLVFHGAFIKFFLHSCFAYSLVCSIIELGNEKVIQLAARVLCHNTVDLGNLLLESDHLFHQLCTGGFILDLSNLTLILVNLLIDLLDLLIHFLADIAWHFLKLLDQVKDLGFGKLKLSEHQDIRTHLLLCLKVDLELGLTNSAHK